MRKTTIFAIVGILFAICCTCYGKEYRICSNNKTAFNVGEAPMLVVRLYTKDPGNCGDYFNGGYKFLPNKESHQFSVKAGAHQPLYLCASWGDFPEAMRTPQKFLVHKGDTFFMKAQVINGQITYNTHIAPKTCVGQQ